MKPVQEIVLGVVATLAAVSWLCASIFYALGLRPLGPQRNRAVPWTIFEVLLLAPMVAAGIGRGLMPRSQDIASRTFSIAEQIGLLLVISLPFVLVRFRGAKPYQMGLHFSHCMRNLLWGFASFLLSVPVIAGTNLIALQFFERTPHSIEQVLKQSPTLPNFALISLGAVVIAPFIEELVFRGILLPWLRQVLGPWPAITISSLLFAIAHFDAWPAPIALFVLALFLGYLAYRTTSLVAPIVLHATFNAANMLILLRAFYLGIEY